MQLEDNLLVVAKKIKDANKPEDIFGLIIAKDINEASTILHKAYKKLTVFVAPDKFDSSSKNYSIATEAFISLGKLENEGQELIKSGLYGKEKPPIIISALGKTYELKTKFKSGPIANLYASDNLLAKVSKIPRDNDLLENEKKVLTSVRTFLSSKSNGVPWLAIIPEVHGSFQINIDSKMHRVNMLSKFDDMLTVREIVERIGRIDARTSGWMFKRIFGFLAWSHGAGYVHTAILPNHLLIRPDNFNNKTRDPLKHAVAVVDWCYAVKIGSKAVAWDAQFQEFYAPEIRAKHILTGAADIYMAGMTMLYAVGGDINKKTLPADYPIELATVIKSCIQTDPTKRPTIDKLLASMIAALLKVYGPPKWHHLEVPR